jgi:hypothetical protein
VAGYGDVFIARCGIKYARLRRIALTVVYTCELETAIIVACLTSPDKSKLGAFVISAGELVAPQLRAAYAIAAVAFKRQNGRRQKKHHNQDANGNRKRRYVDGLSHIYPFCDDAPRGLRSGLAGKSRPSKFCG